MTFSSRPGAVLSDDGAVVLHYGSLFPEQRALAGGGVVARGDLSVLMFTGADRLSWLDSLTSQALSSLPAFHATETLILDPHGHIEHALHLVDDGQATWALTAASRVDDAVTWLNRMRFRADVQIRDVSDDYEVIAQYGEIAVDLESHGGIAWRDPWPGVSDGGFGYGGVGADWPVVEWIVPRTASDAVLAELESAGVPIAGALAWTALRIAAGRPEITDVDDRALPHEFDWLRTAVHLSKGCYRGQETVAKVHNLGRPPRRLVLLHLDGSDDVPVATGDELWASKDGEPRAVGHVVAAGQHWEFGPIALGLVKRAMPGDTVVEARHGNQTVSAAQEMLVPADAGPAVELPRLNRMGPRA